MPSIVVKNFNNADEVRTPDKTKAEVVELGNVTAMKITLGAGMEVVRMHQAGGWNRILSKEACWHVGIRENESR